MEKKLKLFKTITIILLIIAISLISFVGVFRTKLNFKENLIPEFKYGMELGGNREFKFTLDTAAEDREVYLDENGEYKGTVVEEDSTTSSNAEVSLDATVEDSTTDVVAEEEVNKVPYATETRTIKANEDEVLNKESYEKTKSIIQKRLEAAQIPEYNIRLNTITGDLTLEVPEDDYTDVAFNLVSQQGKFEIVDSETGVVLLDNSHVKKAQALYTTNNSYQAFLEIDFNNEGKEILSNISKIYVQSTDETGETTTKNVELRLDNQTLLSTYFGEELDNGILQITMGNSTTDYATFVESYQMAQQFAEVVDLGMTPNRLTIASDNFIQSQITKEQIMIAEIIFAVIIAVVSVVLIIKYKYEGFLGAVASVGYIALTMLTVRYTNVVITLNSTIAILAITALNYVFIFNFLNRKKTDSPKHAFLEAIKRLNVAVIPLWVVAVIFTFMTHVAISSVGMIVFWGLFIHAVYSFAITRTLYV